MNDSISILLKTDYDESITNILRLPIHYMQRLVSNKRAVFFRYRLELGISLDAVL
jgi:hypothetical protein